MALRCRPRKTTAYRMQTSVPGLIDLSSEPEHLQKAYGLDRKETAAFGQQCLMARRLVEEGVRCVQIFSGGWDSHDYLERGHGSRIASVDQPIAALINDLKERDLLKDTLIVWGGEFGRTPVAENGNGRDHNHHGFSMWLAGGGVKGGTTYGATDEFGFAAVENKVHVHDLHATILHLMGLDHEKLTFRYSGRDFRLTDVHGRVVRELFS